MNISTGYEQHQRQPSIEPFQDSSSDADEKQDETHLVLARICLLSSSLKGPATRWQQGPRQRDATTSWRASLCQQASVINEVC